jgi:CBS domain-containing protein
MRSKVESCREDDTVQRCAQTMMEAGVGFLPVLNGERRVVGVITDRDLVNRVLAYGKPSEMPVKRFMTPDPIVCHVDDGLGIAEERLARHKKARIVVIDDRGACAGVISMADISQVEDPVKAGKIYRAIAQREVKPPDRH